MKFTRKYVVIKTTGNEVIAFFNSCSDCKDYLLECRKKRPYETYRMYHEVVVK